jgi:allantoicase
VTASFLDLIDLASERLGSTVLDANDEFFASRDNLIKAAAPQWREDEYTDRGKWMDGWETRRRRDVTIDAHDWCVIRFGVSGVVRGIDVDTSHFKGNVPESCAFDLGDGCNWTEVVPRTALGGDRHNLIDVKTASPATHARLRIFPDGGVARLRIYGDVVADWSRLRLHGDVDLAAVEHGGLVVACSDMSFGSRHNLIMPGPAAHMGDGWETRRRRGPGHDWSIIRLGTRGAVRRVEVDTRLFKGNAPGAFSLEGSDDSTRWCELMPRTPLSPHSRQTFEDEVCAIGDIAHVRFNIFPDGGVGRLRLFGRPCVEP